MSAPSFHLLLVHTDPDTSSLADTLKDYTGIDAVEVDNGRAAARTLAHIPLDAVLIDSVSATEEAALDALSRSYGLPPQPPVILRIDRDAPRATIQKVTAFLIRGPVDIPMLERALRYAIGSMRVLEEAHTQALYDRVSGLFTASSFRALGEQLLKIAKRASRGTLLVMAKIINFETLTRPGGVSEEALMKTIGKIFRSTFRESDMIARAAADEIWVMALEVSPEDTPVLIQRLVDNIDEANAGRSEMMEFARSLSYFDPLDPVPVERLLRDARKRLEAELGG